MLTTSSEIPSVCQRVFLLWFPGHKAQGIDINSVWFLNLTIYFHPWPENKLLIFQAATIYVVLLLGNKQQTGLSGNGNSTTQLGERQYEKGRKREEEIGKGFSQLV